jgi:hypothetical protein
MAQETVKEYSVEVKARLVKCSRCDGWVYAEPVMGDDAYLVCLNCGWEKPIRAKIAAGARVSH